MHILVIGGSGRIGQLVIDESLKRGHTVTALVRDETKLEKKEGLTIVKGDPKLATSLPPAFTPPPNAIITTLSARRQTDSPFSQPSTDSPPRLLADIHANLAAQIAATTTTTTTTQQPPATATTATAAHTKTKLVILSMAGCTDSISGLPLITRALFAWSPMRHQLVDHGLVDAEIRVASRREQSATTTATTEGQEGRRRARIDADNGEVVGGNNNTTNNSNNNKKNQFDFTFVRPVMFSEGDAAPVKVWPESAKGVGLTSKITRKSVASFMVDAAEKEEWDGKAPVISN